MIDTVLVQKTHRIFVEKFVLIAINNFSQHSRLRSHSIRIYLWKLQYFLFFIIIIILILFEDSHSLKIITINKYNYFQPVLSSIIDACSLLFDFHTFSQMLGNRTHHIYSLHCLHFIWNYLIWYYLFINT